MSLIISSTTTETTEDSKGSNRSSINQCYELVADVQNFPFYDCNFGSLFGSTPSVLFE